MAVSDRIVLEKFIRAFRMFSISRGTFKGQYDGPSTDHACSLESVLDIDHETL